VKSAPVYRPEGLCTVCRAPEAVRLLVNGAIWNADGHRGRTYRVAGVDAYQEATAKSIDARTIQRHVAHIERDWRQPTDQAPARGDEEDLLRTDFASVTDRMARLGVKAAKQLEADLPKLTDKDRLDLAKLGLRASTAQENVLLKRGQQNIDLVGVFLLASKRVEMPEHEIRVVTPPDELRQVILEERRLLTARAGREPDATGG
jgi:hypothetical protein